MTNMVIKEHLIKNSINPVTILENLVKVQRDMNNWKGGTKEVEG
jgi:hypothetical protein